MYLNKKRKNPSKAREQGIIMKHYAIIIFCLTFFSFSLFAQEGSREEANELDTIIIQATRSKQSTFDIPGMGSVVDLDAPNMIAPGSLSDIFAGQPWLTITKSARRNGQNINMRGYGGDSVLVLLDGVRQNFSSQHDGKFFIDPALIKRIEVVRGASSALYGGGGLGGVVGFQTVSARDLLKEGENFGILLTTAYQSVSNEYLESGAVYGRTDSLDILGSFNWRTADNIHLGDGSEFTNDEHLYSGLFKLSWAINPSHTIGTSIQGYHNNAIEPNNPQGNQPGVTPDVALFAEVDKDNSSYTTRLLYEYDNPKSDLFIFKGQAYTMQTQVLEKYRDMFTRNVGTMIIPPVGPPMGPPMSTLITETVQLGDKQARKLERLGLLLDGQSVFGTERDAYQNTLSYGFEYYNDKQDGKLELKSHSDKTERGGVPDAKADYVGVYLQDEINWSPTFMSGEFILIPGVRYDEYNSKTTPAKSASETTKKKNKSNATSSKFGLTYKPIKWLAIFSSYAEGFRAPTVTEIYATGPHFVIPAGPPGPPVTIVNNFVTNEELKPEKNRTYESGLGFKFQNIIFKKDSFKLKGSYYVTKAHDFIEPEVTQTTTQIVNRPNATLWGWEAELKYQSPRLDIIMAHSYVRGKYRRKPDEAQRFITSIVPNKFVGEIAVKISEIDSILGFRVTLVGRHDEVNAAESGREKGTFPIKEGYSVYDMYYQYKPTAVEGLILKLGIDNIGDKEYERVYAGSPEPGSNYKANLSYQWGT